jgi:mannosyltransferase
MIKHKLNKEKIKKKTIILLKSPLFWIILLGLFLRLFKYTAESIWLDESISIFLAYQNPLFIISYLDPTPPLFYLLLHYWSYLGKSEEILKLLTIILSTLTIPVVYGIANKIYSKRVGFYSALLVAVSPMHIFYSQELRVYSLLFLSTALVVYFYFYFDKSRWYRFFYAIFFITTIYSHFYGLFILFAIQLHRFINKRIDFFSISKWLKTHTIISLFLIPWIFWVYRIFISNEASWIKIPEIKDIIDVFFYSIRGETNFILGTILFYLAVSLFFLSFYYKFNRFEYYWIIIPIIIPFILSFFLKPFFYYRYALIISIPLYIVISSTIDKIPQKKIILSLFILLSLSVVFLQSYTIIKDPWEEINVNRPVAFIAFYEAFPYIYINEPDCFNEKTIDDVYICAAKKGIYAIQPEYPLEDEENTTIILSKHWLIERDYLLSQKYIKNNSDLIEYTMNNDVWIFRNYATGHPIIVILPD